MSKFIGIDLGTTFSVVAQIDETGRPVIVANRAGNNITPSVVEFKEDNTVEVGAEARRRLFVDENAVGRFKRAMGTSRTYEVRGKTYTPTQLSAFVLKKLIQDTKEAIGPIADVIVSIPANFANEARDATLAAAKEAGFDIKYIVNEPTAAALYYAYKGGTELSGTYAVYDLGGGTFDISIIRVQGQDVEVLAASGIAQCGGDDFDRALHQVIKNKYKKVTGEDLNEEDFSVNDAEEEKISLSRRDKVVARVARQNIEITRNEFEESIASLISQARLLTEATVDEVDIAVEDLSGVFLVGGSTRIPAVLKSVRNVFGKEPISSANVDEVVALGAAIYAAYKGDRTKLNEVQRKTIEKIKVSESTAMCFGVIAADQERGELYNSVMIKKNEKIPCSRTESFYTIHEGQDSVDIEISESRSPERDPTFVKIIQKGELGPLPSGRPSGQEIKITYSFDDNQIMHCKFVDVASGREEVFALSPTQGSKGSTPHDSQIDKFTVE
jgi:molecular chaperone DnaK